MFVVSWKILFWGILGPFWSKNTYFIISGSALRFFSKVCSLTSYYKRTKVACFSFSKKSCFEIYGQFGSALGQNFQPFSGKSMQFMITILISSPPNLEKSSTANKCRRMFYLRRHSAAIYFPWFEMKD